MKEFSGVPDGRQLTSEEVSNHVYQVRLISRHGPSIELNGTDVDKLVAHCMAWAIDVQQQLGLP